MDCAAIMGSNFQIELFKGEGSKEAITMPVKKAKKATKKAAKKPAKKC
jgi:hypothetical protein